MPERNQTPNKTAPSVATESAPARTALIALALAFLALFLILPVVVVFTEAF